MQFPSLVLALIDLLRRFFYFMEYWKITSLENLQEIYEGVLYIEEWRPIPGYEGIYEVSSFGRVKSLPRIIKSRHNSEYLSKEFIMTGGLSTKGYVMIHLRKDGKSRKWGAHRLVMLAFIEDSDLFVDHKKMVRTDNRLWMLEYVTNRENIRRGKKMTTNRELPMGVYKNPNGGGYGVRMRYTDEVGKHRNGNFGTYPTVSEAQERYNLVSGDIKNIKSYLVPRAKKFGVEGIQFLNGKYRVRDTINGKRTYVGHFKELEDAKDFKIKYDEQKKSSQENSNIAQ